MLTSVRKQTLLDGPRCCTCARPAAPTGSGETSTLRGRPGRGHRTRRRLAATIRLPAGCAIRARSLWPPDQRVCAHARPATSLNRSLNQPRCQERNLPLAGHPRPSREARSSGDCVCRAPGRVLRRNPLESTRCSPRPQCDRVLRPGASRSPDAILSSIARIGLLARQRPHGRGATEVAPVMRPDVESRRQLRRRSDEMGHYFWAILHRQGKNWSKFKSLSSRAYCLNR